MAVIADVGIRWTLMNPKTFFDIEEVCLRLLIETEIVDLRCEKQGFEMIVFFIETGDALGKLRSLQKSMIKNYQYNPEWVVRRTGEYRFIGWNEHLDDVGKICITVANLPTINYLGH